MKRTLAGLLVAAALLTAGMGSAVDAKGSLTVNPTPVVLGSQFTLDGCGYPAPTSLSFHVVGPGEDYFTAGDPELVQSNGCFSDTWLAWWPDGGAYQITSYYRDKRGATRKVAVVKFTVTN